MLESALKLPGSEEALRAFSTEFSRSNDFGKAWNALVVTAWKNGSAIPLLMALFSDAWTVFAQNPWAKEQLDSWFNPRS
jgi:hypothetical protein